MGNINQATLEGFLARDAIETAHGSLLMTIATNKSRKNKETNEWEDIPSFINASLSFPSDYQKDKLKQGAHVFTTGELRSYVREREGRKETVMVYEVRQISFAPRASRPEGGVQTPPPRQSQPQPRPNVQTAAQQFKWPSLPQRPQPQQSSPQPRPTPAVASPQNDDFSEFTEFEEGYNWPS